EGSALSTATGEVRNSQITASTTNGAIAVAIRLSRTAGVTIADNTSVGQFFSSAGRAFSAGIADGMVLRDGTLTRGDSTSLNIQGNQTIAGGASWWATPCTSPGATGEGADVTAGIFL